MTIAAITAAVKNVVGGSSGKIKIVATNAKNVTIAATKTKNHILNNRVSFSSSKPKVCANLFCIGFCDIAQAVN